MTIYTKKEFEEMLEKEIGKKMGLQVFHVTAKSQHISGSNSTIHVSLDIMINGLLTDMPDSKKQEV